MCYFSDLDGTGFLEHSLQIIFLTAGCLVSYTGLVIAIFLVGLLPVYVYGYCVFSKRIRLSSLSGRLSGVFAFIMTLLLSGILWSSAIALGSWG